MRRSRPFCGTARWPSWESSGQNSINLVAEYRARGNRSVDSELLGIEVRWTLPTSYGEDIVAKAWKCYRVSEDLPRQSLSDRVLQIHPACSVDCVSCER